MRMHDRSFVGADGVGSGLECGADVRDGRFAGPGVERTGFEQRVGPGANDPIGEAAGFLRFREVTLQNSLGAESLCRNEPSDAPSGESGDAVLDAVALAQVAGFAVKQPDEASTNIAESNQAEVEGADTRGSWLE